jgi:signal transduction histidine kinase
VSGLDSARRWELDSPGRLTALAALDLVPGVADPMFEPYTRLVSRMLGAPVALVSFVTDDRQVFASAEGLAEPFASSRQTPLELSFCQHVVTTDDELAVTDSTQDPRVSDNLAIDVLGVRAYLGVPLRAPGGEPLGSLCAIDSRPRQWTAADLDALRDIAEATSAAIALRTSEHRQRAYAAEASHQLRTPIAALSLELEDLALWPQADAGLRAGLGAATDHVQHLAGIVDDLVLSARGNGRLAESRVDLRALVAEAVAHWEQTALDLGRQLTLEPGPPVALSTIGPAVRRIVDLVIQDALMRGVGPLTVEVVNADGASRIRILHDRRITVAVDGPGLAQAVELAPQVGGRLATVTGSPGGVELLLPPPSAR